MANDNITPPPGDNAQADGPATIAELKQMIADLAKKNAEHDASHRDLVKKYEEISKEPLRRPFIRPIRLNFNTPVSASARRTGNMFRVNAEGPESRGPNTRQEGPVTGHQGPVTNQQGNDTDQQGPQGHQENANDATEENQHQPPRTEQTDDDNWCYDYSEIDELRAEIARNAEEMKAFRSQVHKATSQTPEIDLVLAEAENTPFAPKILSFKFSDPGRLSIPDYDGTTDPRQHLTAFQIAMNRANFRDEEKDAGYCTLFVEHLKGPALYWFSKLEAHSIHSYRDLTTKFMTQYSMFINPGSSAVTLCAIRQGEHEPLRTFLQRFKEVLAQVGSISDHDAVEALKRAVWFKSEFWKELAINTPRTIRDALYRASNFIRLEEEISTLSHQHERTQAPLRAPEATLPPPPPLPKKGGTQSAKYVKHETAGGAHNYQLEEGRGQPPWSRNNAYDKNAYCDFHEATGHSTENCRTLGLILTRKLAAGELRGDLTLKELATQERARRAKNKGQADTGPEADKEAQKRERPLNEGRNPEPNPRRRINMIIGGSQYCPDTVSAIKAYQRRAETSKHWQGPPPRANDVITFEEKEISRIDRPHCDPLVIELTVNDYDVARILIDTGSSVDVIFRDTLEKMGLKLTDVRADPRPLTGFSGATTMTLGSITLPVRACDEVRMVEFAVADHPAIYNIILGTPWINSMRAIPSTYHLCLKFPTSSGTRTIWGSQKESRICLLAEHKLRSLPTNHAKSNKKVKPMTTTETGQLGETLHQLHIQEGEHTEQATGHSTASMKPTEVGTEHDDPIPRFWNSAH